MTADPAAIPARALWFTAPRTVSVRDAIAPPPGPGEVRVRAIASAISQGTEMLVYRGQVPHDLPLDLPTLEGGFSFPIKYGYACVGRVVDAGTDVANVEPGDLVFCLHPHQTVFTLPAALAVPLPPDLDPLAGVFTANLETAVNALLDAPLHFGETVAVFGLGTVGTLIAALLRRAGASPVIGVDPLPLRREGARKLGVDVTLDPAEGASERIRALTDGRGADIAIEASGSPAGLQAALDAVADEGAVVAVSWYGTKPAPLMLGGHFHRGRVRVVSSQVGRINPALAPRWDRERRTRLVRELLASARWTGLVSHRFPLDQAAAAYRLVDEEPERTTQVVFTYQDG